MRFRDCKLYVLLTIMVLALVLVFNFYYETAYKNKINDYAMQDALKDCEGDLITVSDKILEIRYDYYNNTSTTVETSNDYKDGVTSYFNDGKYCIKQASVMQNVEDTTYYFYILDSNNNRIGRTSLENIYKIDRNLKYSMVFNALDGTNIYSSTTIKSFYSVLRDNGNNSLEDIQTAINENKSFSKKIKIEKKSFYVLGVYLDDGLYYTEFVPQSEYLDSLNSLKVLSIVFSGVAVLSMIFAITISFMTIRKGNKLIAVSRRAAARNDAVIIRARKNGTIMYINHRVKTLTNHPDKLKNIFDFKTVDGISMKECLKTEDKRIVTFEVDGKTLYFEFMVFHYNGTYYLIGTDITIDYNTMKSLEDLTSKNPVTTLPNYYQLFSDFEKIKKESFNKVLAFLMINIVEYNEIKKLFGGDVINQLVVDTSKRIKETVGKNLVFHTENDTFVVLISSAMKDENTKVIEKLFTRLHETFTIKTNTLYIKFKFSSYEVANAQASDITIEDVFRKLDVTMSRAKASVNREYIKYDATIQNYVNHRENMQEDIVKAIENNEFVMYYQPQYDVVENRIAGFESLIRWNNPKYIGVSPQEYIELAERNGYIIDIGNFIIQDVFKTAKQFEPYGIHISINVSPAQLFQAGFTGFLLEEFEKNHLQKGSIAIEITETFLMENFSVIIEKLNLLRNKGFSIHLDDFGTGYSSMLYLKELPIDTIKTDMEFIKNLTTDNYSRMIVKSIISMAKSLDLKVISEGVETEGQAEILKKLGTDYFQGYLISRAVPFNEAMNMVKNGVEIKKKIKKGRE